MTTRFVGRPIQPDLASIDTAALARGEPGLARVFLCDGQEHHVVEILETWKDTGPCRSGSDERYVRRHWYRVRTAAGLVMRLYCLRQSAAGKPRWWLYAVDDPVENVDDPGRE